MRRRSVLSFLGLGGVGIASTNLLAGCLSTRSSRSPGVCPFTSVQVPLPLENDGLSAAEQRKTFREIALDDRLTVPDGFRSSLLAAWGDPLGESRFGFNNDHLGFVQHDGETASMTVNFEYISAVPWVQGFQEVVGHPLPSG